MSNVEGFFFLPLPPAPRKFSLLSSLPPLPFGRSADEILRNFAGSGDSAVGAPGVGL